MNTRRIFSIAAALLLLAGCSHGSAPDRPRPTATASATSPSGHIVFSSGSDIWSIDPDGTGLTRLTRPPGPNFDPTWSPDGSRIAFRSERSGEPEIWLMNADGSGQHRLGPGLSPAWSPDGSRIAFASPGEIPCPPARGLRCSGLSIMNADGSGRQRVPGTDGGEYPSWSPDGKRIAFNSNFSGDHLMYILDVGSSRVLDLSKVGEGWQVDWSPDGGSILFTSHRDHPDGYTDLYVMRPDGSGVTRLTRNIGQTPAWSPDGSQIVYSAPGLAVMRANGSGMTSLPTAGVGETTLPDWRH